MKNQIMLLARRARAKKKKKKSELVGEGRKKRLQREAKVELITTCVMSDSSSSQALTICTRFHSGSGSAELSSLPVLKFCRFLHILRQGVSFDLEGVICHDSDAAEATSEGIRLWTSGS